MRTGSAPVRRTWRATVVATVVAAALTVGAIAPTASAATPDPLPRALSTRALRPLSECTSSTDPARRWVQLLYLSAVGRCAEPAASDYAVSQYQPGNVRNTFAKNVFRTVEGSMVWTEIAYELVLDRSADPGGLQYWSSRLRNGLRFDALEAALLGSAEYYEMAGGTDEDWVFETYFRMLERDPSSADAEFWVDQIRRRGSRTSTASAILGSHEFRALTALQFGYGYIFERGATPAEYDFWAGRLLQIDTLDLMAQFVASQEGINLAQDPDF